MTIGWDNPRTATLYERFNDRHGRYRDANDALVAHASLHGDLDVLDVAAGTGRTAEAALERLGDGAHVVCYEPAGEMRAVGRARLDDPRVTWTRELPASERFDRVLCGAAIWQLGPLSEAIEWLTALVRPGGALAFTIPALYLGEGDEPGGGTDPQLHQLLAQLCAGRAIDAPHADPLPGADDIDALLPTAERWTLRRRVSQDELRDWLSIPVLTDYLLPDLSPDERLEALAEANVDEGSWRWERWYGWTRWC